MRLINYIKGDRIGEQAHKVESDMLHDRFLSDAIEGYNKHEDINVLIRDIGELEKEIIIRSAIKKRGWKIWLGVGLIIAVVGLLIALFVIKYGGNRSTKETIVKDKIENIEQGNQLTPDLDQSPVIFDEGLYDIDNVLIDPAEALSGAGKVMEGDKKETVGVSETVQSGAAEQSVTGGVKKSEVEAITDDGRAAQRDEKAKQREEQLKVEGQSVDNSQMLISIHTYSSESGEMGRRYLSSPRTGLTKYNEYLVRARDLPEESLRGEVTITFRVNQYGRPSSMRVEASPSQEANQEVLRLLGSGPEWYPTKGDERVEVKIVL